MSMSLILNKLFKDRGVTPYEVSIKTGISESTFSRVLNNETKKLGIRNTEILANYFILLLPQTQTSHTFIKTYLLTCGANLKNHYPKEVFTIKIFDTDTH
mgnify:CR=1 FL=1